MSTAKVHGLTKKLFYLSPQHAYILKSKTGKFDWGIKMWYLRDI